LELSRSGSGFADGAGPADTPFERRNVHHVSVRSLAARIPNNGITTDLVRRASDGPGVMHVPMVGRDTAEL
jgi:hypothetical protein